MSESAQDLTPQTDRERAIARAAYVKRCEESYGGAQPWYSSPCLRREWDAEALKAYPDPPPITYSEPVDQFGVEWHRRVSTGQWQAASRKNGPFSDINWLNDEIVMRRASLVPVSDAEVGAALTAWKHAPPGTDAIRVALEAARKVRRT